MIGSLRGTLLARDGEEVLVEVGGVGHRVSVGPATAIALGEIGAEVFVWVHHHIREDAHTLYGFATAEGRRTFTALLGAHKVGPSLALAILSVHEPGDLARILADDDVDALCLVPGVGKKTATRLLIELKSRLDIPIDVTALDVPSASGAVVPASARADVRDALGELGYAADEIRSVMADLPDGDDAGELLKAALVRLAVAG